MILVFMQYCVSNTNLFTFVLCRDCNDFPSCVRKIDMKNNENTGHRSALEPQFQFQNLILEKYFQDVQKY